MLEEARVQAADVRSTAQRLSKGSSTMRGSEMARKIGEGSDAVTMQRRCPLRSDLGKKELKRKEKRARAGKGLLHNDLLGAFWVAGGDWESSIRRQRPWPVRREHRYCILINCIRWANNYRYKALRIPPMYLHPPMPPAWAPLGIVRSAGSTKALAKGSERRALAIMAGPPCGKRTRLTLYIQDGYVYNAWSRAWI